MSDNGIEKAFEKLSEKPQYRGVVTDLIGQAVTGAAGGAAAVATQQALDKLKKKDK